MNLKEKIAQDLKTALKEGNKSRINAVRSIRALILEHEKSGAEKELTPDQEIAMLSSAVKKRKESIEQFKKGGREDRAEEEQKEIDVIQQYLPEQLSEEEIQKEIEKTAKAVGAETKADFGKLMGAAMKQLKGKAEGAEVKKAVEKFLGSN